MDVISEKHLLKILHLKDESVRFIKWDSIRSPVIIGSVGIGTIIGVTVRSLFINYVAYHAPKNRPINFLIGIDQFVQLVTLLMMALAILTTLITGETIYSLLGEPFCMAFSMATFVHNYAIVLGGCGLAIFRLMSIKAMVRIDSRLLVKVILAFEFAILILFGAFYYLALSSNPTVMTMQFCHGLSNDALNVINDASRDNDFLFDVLVFTWLFFNVSEVMAYVSIFVDLYQHNTKVASEVLGQDVIKMRKRRNAITLAGQCLTFVNGLVAWIIAKVVFSNIDWFEPAYYSIVLVFLQMGNSLAQFFTSPEMKRFYFEQKFA